MCRRSRERLEQAHGEFYNQEVHFALGSEINEQPLEFHEGPNREGALTVPGLSSALCLFFFQVMTKGNLRPGVKFLRKVAIQMCRKMSSRVFQGLTG